MNCYLNTRIAFSLMVFLGSVHARTDSCNQGETPCGPGDLCCASTDFCNYNRGIPACENSATNFISGFNGPPCPDPYLYSCASAVGESVCCPIGTVCYNDDTLSAPICIDAYGAKSSAVPSASASASAFLPMQTPVSNTASGLVFSPADAWKEIPTTESCSESQTLHTTSTINATITFTYTGPSIMIHYIISQTGGRFSVTVDGFDTGSVVDTNPEEQGAPTPACVPVQFPPFHAPPPDYASRDNHTIVLTYVGAADNTTATGITFDSFAMPSFDRSELTSNGKKILPPNSLLMSLLLIAVSCLIPALL